MIRVVFVRHGAKQPIRGRPDQDAPLDIAEDARLALMADALDAEDLRPQLWWASHFDHCWQSAARLNRSNDPVYRLCGLTPYSAEEGFTAERMMTESSKLGAPMGSIVTLGIVGHEERLSNLATMLVKASGVAVAPLAKTEVVIIGGDTWWDLYAGKGVVEQRWSVPPSVHPT